MRIRRHAILVVAGLSAAAVSIAAASEMSNSVGLGSASPAAMWNATMIPPYAFAIGWAVLRILLLAGFLFSTVTAVKIPGTGFPEMAAVLLLGALLIPAIITGDARWYEIALIVGGLALLCVEIFVIPGFGATGVAGMLLLAIGFLLAFLPAASATHTISFIDFRNALTILVGGSVLGLASFVWLSSRLPMLSRTSKLVLRETNAIQMPAHLWPGVGDVGIALTDLKPGGIVQLPDPEQMPKRVDVVSRRGFIPAGSRVIVIEVVGQVITVKEAVES